MTEAFQKQVDFKPAWDRTDPDPIKNYGIHGVEIEMLLGKDKRWVVFGLMTDWYLPKNQERIESSGYGTSGIIPRTVAYHSPIPLNDPGVERLTHDCPFTGGDCYSTGYLSLADDYFKTLVELGSDAIWQLLENYWHETFDEEMGE